MSSFTRHRAWHFRSFIPRNSALFIFVLFLVLDPSYSDLSYFLVRVAIVVCVELSQFFPAQRAVCYYLVISFSEPYARCYTEFCVMAQSEKALKPGQTWLLGFLLCTVTQNSV